MLSSIASPRSRVGLICALACLWAAAGGCGSSPSGTLDISAGEVDPGGFITVSHPAFIAGQEVAVRFLQEGGGEVPVAGQVDDLHSARVCVPPFIDPLTGWPGAGTWEVRVDGVDGSPTLRVRDLPELGDVPTGLVVQTLLESAIADFQAVEASLRDPAGPLASQPGTAAALTALEAEVGTLQTLVDELAASQTLTIASGEGGTVTYSDAELRMMDRWALAAIQGLEAELALARPAQARVTGSSDCIANLPDNYTGDQFVDCFRQALRNIKNEANRAFSGGGGLIASGAGLIIFVGGLATGASEGVLVLGAVTSVVGVVQGYVAAAASGQNTDAIMQGDGGKFSASGEALSQVARYAAGPVSNTLSLALTIKDLNSAAATLRCTNPEAPRALEADSFCTACDCDPDTAYLEVCENTCLYAGDGVCDDGGPNAIYAVCALGSDCTDCGARGSEDAGDTNRPNGCWRVDTIPSNVGGSTLTFVWEFENDQLVTLWRASGAYTVESVRFDRPNGGLYATMLSNISQTTQVAADRGSLSLRYSYNTSGSEGGVVVNGSTSFDFSNATLTEDASGSTSLEGTFTGYVEVRGTNAEGEPYAEGGPVSGRVAGVAVTCPDPFDEFVVTQEEYLDAVMGGG